MSWFENIAGCMLAVGLALRMLPDKKYEQYVRLFTGFLLLILLRPAVRLGSADELMERKIEQFLEEQEVVEQQILEQGTVALAQSGMEGEQEERKVQEIVIEPIEVEVSGND